MINWQTDRGIAVAQSPTQRSRVTNGRSLFPREAGDMRNPWARRLKDVFALHVDDIGGTDGMRQAERLICRRAAVLTVELERLEVRFATDTARERDLDTYVRASGNLRRLLEAIAVVRNQKNVTTLGDLLREDLDRQSSARGATMKNNHRLHDIQAASRGHPLHEMRRGLSG